MALPNEGISFTMVATELGTTENSLGNLCAHPNVNRWSKKKPQIDTRVAKNELNYWRRSDVSDNIRCGLNIYNNSGSVWEYPQSRMGCFFRLGDFREYDKDAVLIIELDLPNTIAYDSDYIATFIFNANTSNTSVSLHDLFDLENKYCCVAVDMRAGNKVVKAKSPRIEYSEIAELYGQQVTISKTDMDIIINEGGTITIEMYFVEADDYFEATGLSNPKIFSLRATAEIQTIHYNTQFLAQGFVILSNFDTMQPIRNNLIINNLGYERVLVSSDFRTGGVFTNHWFQAKILGGNTMGLPYTYELPTLTLGSNQTEIMAIPEFSIQLLEDKDVILEYSVWDGVPEQGQKVLSKTYNLPI